MEHWWNDTDRGEWSIGGMILTGESGTLVEWYWQGRVEHWWNDTDRGRQRYLEKKNPVFVSLYPPQIPHELTWDGIRASSVGDRPLSALSNPITGLDRPWGFQEVEAPTFKDSRHMKVVRLSAVRTGRLYPPGNIPGTHFCYRLSQPTGHNAAGRIPLTQSGIEPATFQLVKQCLNQLFQCVPSDCIKLAAITTLWRCKLSN
jgi:hypothetical protein